MNRTLALLALAGLMSAPAALGTSIITIGEIYLIDNGNGTSQFSVINNTGITDGCSTAGGFPVCTILDISGTLTYSYTKGSSTVTSSVALVDALGPDDLNPGDIAYAPAEFEFETTAASFKSASFSGSFTPVSFTTDIGHYTSGGTVATSADIIANGGFALLNTTATASVAAVPEPSSVALAIGGLLFLTLFRREHLSKLS